MLHTIISLILISGSVLANAGQVELLKPLPDLFSHRAHLESFKGLGLNCTDCHGFDVKTRTDDPLSGGVKKGFLHVERKVCHECHLGKVNTPRPNQCALCHKDVERLMPQSHSKNWRHNHGNMAQVDRDSCNACHTDRSCSQCHTQRNFSKPAVHRPNFRLAHSVEARSNPQGCVLCHASTNMCIQCHTKGRQ